MKDSFLMCDDMITTILSSMLAAAISSMIMGFIVLYPDFIKLKLLYLYRFILKNSIRKMEESLEKDWKELKWSINPSYSGKRIGKKTNKLRKLKNKLNANKSLMRSDGSKITFPN